MEDESVDINYKKGFNHVYWLASDDGKKYLDEIVKGIKDKESIYHQALLADKKQYEKDKFIEQVRLTREHSKDKTQEF